MLPPPSISIGLSYYFIFSGKSLAKIIDTVIVYFYNRCCLLLCGKSGDPKMTSYLNFSEHLAIRSSLRCTDESSKYSNAGKVSIKKRSSTVASKKYEERQTRPS